MADEKKKPASKKEGKPEAADEKHPAKAAAPPDPSMQGFLHVAFLRDMQTAPAEERAQKAAQFRNIQTRHHAKQHLAEVRHRVEP